MKGTTEDGKTIDPLNKGVLASENMLSTAIVQTDVFYNQITFSIYSMDSEGGSWVYLKKLYLTYK